MTDNPTCETCRWFSDLGRAISGGTYGCCRRFPEWQYLSPSHHCGEHQPRQPAEAEALGAGKLRKALEDARHEAGKWRAAAHKVGDENAAICAERDRAMKACEQMGERVAMLEDVLGPFASVANCLDVSDNLDGLGFVWKSTMHRESISTWLGPSDFGRARAALSGTPPRPRIDPETRLVLERLVEAAAAAHDAYGNLPSDDDGDTDYHELEAALNYARNALAKLDGGDHD